MVAVGAETIRAYERITADVCFLGIWSLHAEAGISGRYREEAEVRRVMVERADRVVGLTTRDKLGTVSAFASAPATALTHLAVEPGTPEELAPFRELGIATSADARRRGPPVAGDSTHALSATVSTASATPERGSRRQPHAISATAHGSAETSWLPRARVAVERRRR